jgi:phosphohistidine phosphatase
MSRLLLLRHARARWAEPGSRDFDRPLDPGGLEDARSIGAAMVLAGLVPDKVLCSSARRARETWEAAAPHLGSPQISFTDGLYSSDSAGYVDIIQEGDGEGSLLVVGHNPMMEDLTLALARDGEAEAMEAVAAGFPTCGLAVIRFKSPLSQIAPDDGYLETFMSPRDL